MYIGVIKIIRHLNSEYTNRASVYLFIYTVTPLPHFMPIWDMNVEIAVWKTTLYAHILHVSVYLVQINICWTNFPTFELNGTKIKKIIVHGL